jgi:hypothetical protein
MAPLFVHFFSQANQPDKGHESLENSPKMISRSLIIGFGFSRVHQLLYCEMSGTSSFSQSVY